MKIQLRLREKLFLFLHLLSAAFAVSADAADDWKLQNLRTELLSEPMCIDSAKPRFSWQIAGSGYGFLQ